MTYERVCLFKINLFENFKQTRKHFSQTEIILVWFLYYTYKGICGVICIYVVL